MYWLNLIGIYLFYAVIIYGLIYGGYYIMGRIGEWTGNKITDVLSVIGGIIGAIGGIFISIQLWNSEGRKKMLAY